jgi:hypothetical protein
MFMKILWIGGWASPWKPWIDQLSLIAPNENHTWHDVNEKISVNDHFDLGIAWSLGALTACRNPNLAKHWILVNPALYFCDVLGWSPAVLRKMIRQIDSEESSVREGFATRMEFNSLEEREVWLNESFQVSKLDLIDGLMELREKSKLDLPLNSSIIQGSSDQICLPDRLKVFAKNHPNVYHCTAGHWILNPDIISLIGRVGANVGLF